MAIKSRKFSKGVRLKATDDAATLDGEIRNDATNKKLKVNLDSSERSVVTEDQTQTLTNKTIDANGTGNNISNIETDDFAANVVDTDVALTADSDTRIATQKATKAYVDSQVAGKDDASEITYTPSTLADWDTSTDPGNTDGGIDQLASRVKVNEGAITTSQSTADDHIADATDAHTASAITNVPSGNLAATTLQGAVNELQTELDGKAVSSEITDHINDVADAHAASAITNTPAGNLAATTQQAANDELQTDIDTRATSTELTNHEADTSTHGVTEIVGTTETQVLSGKDIDGGTASNTSRLTVPKAAKATLDALTRKEGTIVYDTDSDKVFKDNGTDLIEIGGSGQGGINYITNHDLEINADGYNEYLDAAGENPVDGTGGTALGTVASRNTTTPMRGSGDLKIAKDAVNRQGEGVSVDFTIDKADQAQKLTISIDYDASHAGYADGDIRFSVYDVTNANLIRINGEDLKGGNGTHIAQFQTAADSTSYRLIAHISSVSAVAYDVYLDNIQVGPREVVKGMAGSDVKSFGTISGTLTTLATTTGSYTRVGQYMHGEIKIAFSGANTQGIADVTMPDGFVIDTAVLQDTSSDNSIDDGSYVTDNSVGVYPALCTFTSPTNLRLRTVSDGGVYESLTTVRTDTGIPFTVANNDFYLFRFKVPIVGWSSNAVTSEDLGQREIVVRAAGNGGGTYTSATPITFNSTVSEDTTGSWDGSTFTVPETGLYSFAGCIRFTTAISQTVAIYVDGSVDHTIGKGNSNIRHVFSGTQRCVKGQLITIRGNVGATYIDDDNSFHLTINKLASPQTILETETVAARYTSNTAQSLPTATSTIVDYDDIDYDTHNAVTTGASWKFTAPVSGHYTILAKALIDTSTGWSNGKSASLIIHKNAGEYSHINYNEVSVTDAVYMHLSGSDDVYLAKGDFIDLRVNHTSGLTENLITAYTYNSVSIKRIK